MNPYQLLGAILIASFAVSSHADVLKLDCQAIVKKDAKTRNPYMAAGYLVDFHKSHGSSGKALVVIDQTANVGNDQVVGQVSLTQSYEDGFQWFSAGDAQNAKVTVTQFVTTEGPKVLIGEKRECVDNTEGKKCVNTASYGYWIDLDAKIFAVEDKVLYKYQCEENPGRPELAHDESDLH